MSQNEPSVGDKNVTPEARILFEKMINEKIASGIQKYGTVLQTWNGRSPVVDLLEELIDAFQYAVQEKLEREDLEKDHSVLEGCLRNASKELHRAELNNYMLEDYLRKTREALEDVEWCVPTSIFSKDFRCPVCDNRESQGHAKDCALDYLLQRGSCEEKSVDSCDGSCSVKTIRPQEVCGEGTASPERVNSEDVSSGGQQS